MVRVLYSIQFSMMRKLSSSSSSSSSRVFVCVYIIERERGREREGNFALQRMKKPNTAARKRMKK